MSPFVRQCYCPFSFLVELKEKERKEKGIREKGKGNKREMKGNKRERKKERVKRKKLGEKTMQNWTHNVS